jgi:hypothetical protein
LQGVPYDIVTPDAMIYGLRNGVIQDLHVFGGGESGSGPVAKPFLAHSGSLLGTVWEFTPY